MAHRRVLLKPDAVDGRVAEGLTRIRADLAVPGDFPPAVHAEAAVAAAPEPPLDLRDLEFFTLDPAGSMDLDQAMFLERADGGYRVWYAIADVAGFVTPGGAIDAESWARGVTLYLPDGRSPLHPPELSEGAASLLPAVDRPAVVWTIDLGPSGEATGTRVRRALVRSRDRLDYATAVPDDPRIALLKEIGELLIEAEAARGGVSLPLPEQEAVKGADGWRLVFRDGLGSEQWNAQISLLTGRAAAQIMLEGGVGFLRTMPPPQPEALERLRRIASALGIGWPDGWSYGAVIRSLTTVGGREVAFFRAASTLMRGAGYTAFDRGAADLPVPEGDDARHAAVAAPYAHVTAPLRRLADRYALEICLALTSGSPVPAWVTEALPKLGEVMERSLRHGSEIERACLDLVEAVLLADRAGEVFDAVVVEAELPGEHRKGGTVQLVDPSVLGKVTGEGLPLGEAVRVRLSEADPRSRKVLFGYPALPAGAAAVVPAAAPVGRGAEAGEVQ
ncbi:RNB domain-containing ribonuclease [Actinocorallia longicatena]|uniref:RNB domain-containing ribonuclease n=1 Tax=Actinocorallia longicatena TaxID=111803 RepID=A0ABP6Q5A8_9ACTN